MSSVDVYSIEPAPAGTDIADDLRKSKLKLVAEGIKAANAASSLLADCEYEAAISAAQKLHLSIVKACDCEQIIARYFAPTRTSGTGEGEKR